MNECFYTRHAHHLINKRVCCCIGYTITISYFRWFASYNERLEFTHGMTSREIWAGKKEPGGDFELQIHAGDMTEPDIHLLAVLSPWPKKMESKKKQGNLGGAKSVELVLWVIAWDDERMEGKGFFDVYLKMREEKGGAFMNGG